MRLRIARKVLYRARVEGIPVRDNTFQRAWKRLGAAFRLWRRLRLESRNRPA